MQLTQLLYCSKSLNEITHQDAEVILIQSRKNNPPKNITGLLCNNEQYFVQLIEGDYREINDLYTTITADKRHMKATILSYQSARTRLFPNWSMGYIDDNHYINDLLRKYIDTTGLLELELLSKAFINYMTRVSATSTKLSATSN